MVLDKNLFLFPPHKLLESPFCTFSIKAGKGPEHILDAVLQKKHFAVLEQRTAYVRG